MPVYINVPFSEKEVAKSLGAKWDGEARSWYIPNHLDPGRFLRWQQAAIEIRTLDDKPVEQHFHVGANEAMAPIDASTNQNHLTLSAFLSQVSDVINRSFPRPVWIQVEVSKISNRSGHTYFDLIEYDEYGKEVAKARAALWANKKTVLLSKFKQATGSEIQDGMKVLLLMKSEFSGQYGFSFMVEDIDPAYTLGDMQAKLKAIREALQKAGLYDLNKRQVQPVEFTRVAVVSPENAAGLADFMREADILMSAGLCDFRYHAALFQGKGAAASIIKALDKVAKEHHAHPYDALVVIRGGGAASDLAWLNDYDLAARLAQMKLPVFTGIGHQIDDTILDEISLRRFDTPSKVSAHIAGTIVNNAEEAINNYLCIIRDVNKVIQNTENRLELFMNTVTGSAAQAIHKAESEIDLMLHKIKDGAYNAIERADQYLNLTMAEIMGLSPQKTLSRGFGLARSTKGKPLTSAALIKQEKNITLDMHDGQVNLKVIKD